MVIRRRKIRDFEDTKWLSEGVNKGPLKIPNGYQKVANKRTLNIPNGYQKAVNEGTFKRPNGYQKDVNKGTLKIPKWLSDGRK